MKYGRIEKLFGRGYVYVLNKPIQFTHREYKRVNWNPKLGIEFIKKMIDPPKYDLIGIRLSKSLQKKLSTKKAAF